MHELGIAQNILEIAREHAPAGREAAVREIRVRVGPLSGVVPDSLLFCFEAIVRDSDCSRARLVIEPVPLTGVCLDCGERVESNEVLFTCPKCGTGLLQIESGQKFGVSEIELDDQPAEVP